MNAQTSDEHHMFRLSQIMTEARSQGYDLGPPKEEVTINGATVVLRDGLGMKLDPLLYAKKKCSTCFGRGVVTQVHPVNRVRAELAIASNPANATKLHQKKEGHYHEKTQHTCGCASVRYKAKHSMLGQALARAGLAEGVGDGQFVIVIIDTAPKEVGLTDASVG